MLAVGVALWFGGWQVIGLKPKSYWFVSYHYSISERTGVGRIILEIKGKDFLISEAETVIAGKLEKREQYSVTATVALINWICVNKREYKRHGCSADRAKPKEEQ